ncbi:MAG: hypothetical protein ACTHJ0_05460, partial [Flavipsychrobacter sp.]
NFYHTTFLSCKSPAGKLTQENQLCSTSPSIHFSLLSPLLASPPTSSHRKATMHGISNHAL